MSTIKKQPNGAEASYGSRMTYVVGFLLSLALTVSAYWLVKRHVAAHHLSPSDNTVMAGLAALALTQLITQLVFFLHLDRESKPRWNLTVLAFAIITLIIVVAGSLWIMYHLSYNMSPTQQRDYLLHQDGGI